MAKKDIQNVDPVVKATTVVNVYSEDDFDEQFEALLHYPKRSSMYDLHHPGQSVHNIHSASMAQFGVSVFSCDKARKGKKVFGNDPDPTTEIMLDTQDDIISAHIKRI